MSETNKRLDILEILKIIPHRYPYLMLDQITDLEPGKRATGIKNITHNEPQFQGHFPDNPVMPGVLMIEAITQLGAIAGSITDETPRTARLGLISQMNRVKFRRLVRPGDQLALDVEIISADNEQATIHGKASVNGDVAVEADICVSFQSETKG